MAFLAMTEIAVVSARKARLRRLADEGMHRAAWRSIWLTRPIAFFHATRHHLGGVMAGVSRRHDCGGNSRRFAVGSGAGSYGEAIGLTVVVVVITYFPSCLVSWCQNELTQQPGTISMVMAAHAPASIIAGPLVKFGGLNRCVFV